MFPDLLAAVRQLRHSPVHLAVATLSLGIGMAVAVSAFSVMKALVFDDVPGIHRRSSLIRVRWGTDLAPLSEEDFEILEQARGGSISLFAADGTRRLPVVLPSGPVTLTTAFLSSRYFETLGTVAVAGRLLTADDARPDGAPVALIGERLWRDNFAGSADVLGQTITVGGRVFTIVGVTPQGFPGLLQRDVGRSEQGYPQVWLPLGHEKDHAAAATRSTAWLSVIARARPNTSLKQAQAELAAVGVRLTGGNQPGGGRRRVISFRAGLNWTDRPLDVVQVLGVFLFVPVSVLVIACANVINLQLSRATERSRELGVRIALGASTFRLVRLLGIEAAVLSGLAAIIGWQAARVLLSWAASAIEVPVTVDAASMAFTGALMAAVVGAAGIAPAWLATRHAVAAGVRDVRDSGVGHKRLRASLVTAQFAIALALLFVSARGMRTLQLWMPTLPPDADRTLVVEFDLEASHPGLQDSRLFVDAVLQRLDGDRAIGAAGFADFVRTDGSVGFGKPSEGDAVRSHAAGGFVTPAWFDASGVTVVAGRGFERAGARATEAVINEALAATWGGGAASALGQTLRVAHRPGEVARVVEVVGIVADRLTLMGRPLPAIYLPMPRATPGSIVLVVRAAEPASAVVAITAAVRAADPAIPWVSLDTLEARALQQGNGLRSAVWIGAWLGALGLLLAAAGLHAVLAYAIRRRTHEFGIRMAVGADARSIVQLVLRQALGLMVGGLLGGLTIAMPLVVLMRMFPNLSPLDPLSMLMPVSMLLAVGILAAAVPAYRAATVDPLVALREP